ncbi:hypothetical protein CcCBS67573_g02789 [Chytriomyces confervae]|uniref:protein-serine/threonine phosphatase n=1 Tax=Chytriomyces confervae TaxID=246404 RepID=A0A507FJM4_9FUNG|nr:hypothetical protein HDU80_001715 [Chytriomyces hyalinus]TPX75920.1 hypothetical protein CcCBS67573_g02789 [Chytriomyces confervae]
MTSIDVASVSTGDETLRGSDAHSLSLKQPSPTTKKLSLSLEHEILAELEVRLDILELEQDVDHTTNTVKPFDPSQPAKAFDPSTIITKAAQPINPPPTSPYKRKRVYNATKVTSVPSAAVSSKALKTSSFKRFTQKLRILFSRILKPCGSTKRRSHDGYKKAEDADAVVDILVPVETKSLVPDEVSYIDPMNSVPSDEAASEEQHIDEVPEVDDVPIAEELSVHSVGIPYLLPEQSEKSRGKKCLVLDLDETLVCSSFRPVPNADFIIPIDIDGEYHNVYVLKRPHVDQFLERLGDEFEVMVFTASLSNYANPVLDMLDTKRVIQHRLFREHCTYYQGNYVKDLSLLGRPMDSTVIIDNSPAAYLFHPSNAIPCTSWFDDVNDEELLDLVPFLFELNTVPDVRAILGAEMDEDEHMF